MFVYILENIYTLRSVFAVNSVVLIWASEVFIFAYKKFSQFRGPEVLILALKRRWSRTNIKKIEILAYSLPGPN